MFYIFQHGATSAIHFCRVFLLLLLLFVFFSSSFELAFHLYWRCSLCAICLWCYWWSQHPNEYITYIEIRVLVVRGGSSKIMWKKALSFEDLLFKSILIFYTFVCPFVFFLFQGCYICFYNDSFFPPHTSNVAENLLPICYMFGRFEVRHFLLFF